MSSPLYIFIEKLVKNRFPLVIGFGGIYLINRTFMHEMRLREFSNLHGREVSVEISRPLRQNIQSLIKDLALDIASTDFNTKFDYYDGVKPKNFGIDLRNVSEYHVLLPNYWGAKSPDDIPLRYLVGIIEGYYGIKLSREDIEEKGSELFSTFLLSENAKRFLIMKEIYHHDKLAMGQKAMNNCLAIYLGLAIQYSLMKNPNLTPTRTIVLFVLNFIFASIFAAMMDSFVESKIAQNAFSLALTKGHCKLPELEKHFKEGEVLLIDDESYRTAYEVIEKDKLRCKILEEIEAKNPQFSITKYLFGNVLKNGDFKNLFAPSIGNQEMEILLKRWKKI